MKRHNYTYLHDLCFLVSLLVVAWMVVVGVTAVCVWAVPFFRKLSAHIS